MSAARTLKDYLNTHTIAGELYQRHPDDSLTCYACGHRCLIKDRRSGTCRVRQNRGGVLHVPANYVAGLQCDPIEKKPFYHVLPGASAATFGMLGCDYHCAYCQNWLTSQALQDDDAGVTPRATTAEGLVEFASRQHARVVVSSYNEPLITSEWAMQVFKVARQKGFLTGFVSNGNATPEVLDYIRPHTDLFKIDLKSFQDRNYRKLGGVLQTVLDTIQLAFGLGLWVEVVTLLVPGFNDSDAEIQDIAAFVANVSPDIPWHVTAFRKSYRMTEPENTPATLLRHAAEIGFNAGLNFVYAGNCPGRVADLEDTVCPFCKKKAIVRSGFRVLKNNILNGRCVCGAVLPGVWCATETSAVISRKQPPPEVAN